MSCSLLEDIGKKYREENLVKNIYGQSSLYSQVHPNATVAQGGIDDPLNQKGKGTGIPFDTSQGGSSVDINGSPLFMGLTGRVAVAQNKFTASNQYQCEVSDGF